MTCLASQIRLSLSEEVGVHGLELEQFVEGLAEGLLPLGFGHEGRHLSQQPFPYYHRLNYQITIILNYLVTSSLNYLITIILNI